MTRYLASALLLVTGLSWLSMPAQAEEMSYAYMEASAIVDAQFEVERRNIKRDGDAYGVAFAWIMGPIAYSEWSYENYDFETTTEGEIASARLGVRQRIDRFRFGKLDVFAAIAVDYANFERGNPVSTTYVDDTGLGGYIGLRHGPNRFFEYGLELGYNNVENNANFTTAHLQWNATHAVAFKLSYRDANYGVNGPDVDLDTFKLAVRLTFGGG